MRLTVALIAITSVSAVSYAHDEVLIGHDGEGNMAVHAHVNMPVLLPLMAFEEVPGFASPDPGLVADPKYDEKKHILPLPGTARVQAIITAADPFLGVWIGGGFAQLGVPFDLGIAPFHFHPLWNVPPDGPIGLYQLDIVFRDGNGGFADSEPVTLIFETIPEPATAGLLAGAGLLALRRRR
mgnify:CR=1 FL=1